MVIPQKYRAQGGSLMEYGVVGQHYETPYFHPRHGHPHSWNGPAKYSVGPVRLRTDVGRFRSSLHKWFMASSLACECGAEDQTVDHVVLHDPNHRTPHGLHGLTVQDDETIDWLRNICPEVIVWPSSGIVATRSNDEEEAVIAKDTHKWKRFFWKTVTRPKSSTLIAVRGELCSKLFE